MIYNSEVLMRILDCFGLKIKTIGRFRYLSLAALLQQISLHCKL